MNVERLFAAISAEPDQPTLLVAVLELERQGYQVTVANRLQGGSQVTQALEAGDIEASNLGAVMEIKSGGESQTFRLHFLDLAAVAITAASSPPVAYDPRFTISEFRVDADD